MTATIQASAKTPDGRIFVVGGDSFDDFSSNLLAVYGGSGEHVNAVLGEMQDAIAGSAPTTVAAVAAVQAAVPQAAPAPAARTQAGPPPGGTNVPQCAHGPRTNRSGGGPGTGKKAWEAWFCSAPRGQAQCEAQFVS